MIYLPEGPLTAPGFFDLKIVNTREKPESVTWSVDGTVVSGGYIKLTPGEHTIKAVVVMNGGNRRTIIQRIEVQ